LFEVGIKEVNPHLCLSRRREASHALALAI
jgi:hypothetical protein